MTINLSDNNPRVSYNVAQGVTQSSFTVSFEFFDDNDLNVYVDGTLKTLTTDYTVSGGDGSTGTVTISVTGATGGSTVVITRDIDLDRTTDFPSSGPFNIGSLNTELDRFVAIAADLNDRASRSLQLSDYDTSVTVVLPDVDDRKGTVLAFNETTGAVEAGPTTSNVNSLAAITDDIATLADIEDGTDATDAIQTVAGISSNVTTVAGVSANVTTVAGISSDVTTVAGISSDTTTVAGISSNVTTVAGISSDVTTAAGISANITTVAGDSADIQSLAAVSTEIGLLGTADAIADMNTLATSAIVTDMDALANLTTEIDALGDVTADITTVSGISANVTTVAGVSANVTTVAGISGNVTTVAGVSSDVTTVAGISANVTTVAGDTTNIATIATDLTGSDNIGTVAGSISNVNLVGGSIANVNTVATNLSGVNSFAERYRVGASDPTTSLDEGDLFFNTTSNSYKFYDGSSWQTVNVSGIGSVADDATPQLGGNLDVNNNEITSASNGNVVLNPDGTGQIQLNSTVVVQDGTHDFDVASHDGTNGLKLGGALVTATAAELNILDGVTATTAELNYVDGVTSNIQTQIDGISVDPTLGSLTKSFASGETATITLSSTVSPTAVVAVTKEVGQTGASSKGAWDVNATASNYELYEEAPATSLSLSSASADGTATLGTGSFSASDVGKRIFVDDGGEAVITSSAGAYRLVSTFGSTSYTSGNWSLSGLDVDATNGITLSGLSEDNYDVSTASYNQTFSVSAQETAPTDVFFKTDGTKMYIIGTTGDDVNEYNLSTAWDISTASYSQNFSVAVQESAPQGLFFRADGLKMYVSGYLGDAVNEYDLSTAWDISTASHNQTLSVSANNPVAGGVHFRADGLKMYVVEITAARVVEYDLSTAWDISTASFLQFVSAAVQPRAVRFKPDGLKMYVGGQTGNDAIYEYDLSTAWDVSTATQLQSFDVSSQESVLGGFFFRADGFKMYIVGSNGDEVNEYDVGSRFNPTAQYFPALTSAGGQIDSTYWTDINSMTADDTDNDGQAYYAVSTDDRTTWSIAKASDGERDIVRNNGGTWQYNSNATYASTTWSNATTNDEFAAIAQAMTVSVNQMDKTQLDAVTDGSHFALSNTLDLAIILYLASSGEVPTSDGVSINYDAAALNKGAVLGTDYDYDVPATDKVRITSLAAQNLKVRIV